LIGSGDGPIEAELGRMVMTDGLSMEIGPIITQCPSKSLDPAVKDMSQIRPLNPVQQCLNVVKKTGRPSELLAC
jgi:hypothetical protein